MKIKLLICTLTAASITLASGASWSQDQKPIDCSTATDDIATLTHEKKATDERVAKGVFSIMPIGIVLNTASSATESSANKHKEMDAKEYNAKIDQRIAEIKKTCNIH